MHPQLGEGRKKVAEGLDLVVKTVRNLAKGVTTVRRMYLEEEAMYLADAGARTAACRGTCQRVRP